MWFVNSGRLLYISTGRHLLSCLIISQFHHRNPNPNPNPPNKITLWFFSIICLGKKKKMPLSSKSETVALSLSLSLSLLGFLLSASEFNTLFVFSLNSCTPGFRSWNWLLAIWSWSSSSLWIHCSDWKKILQIWSFLCFFF